MRVVKICPFFFEVLKGITRLQATMKARLLSTTFKRMREDKLRAEQESLRRLEREKQQKENEAKLRKVKEQAGSTRLVIYL